MNPLLAKASENAIKINLQFYTLYLNNINVCNINILLPTMQPVRFTLWPETTVLDHTH